SLKHGFAAYFQGKRYEHRRPTRGGRGRATAAAGGARVHSGAQRCCGSVVDDGIKASAAARRGRRRGQDRGGKGARRCARHAAYSPAVLGGDGWTFGDV